MSHTTDTLVRVDTIYVSLHMYDGFTHPDEDSKDVPPFFGNGELIRSGNQFPHRKLSMSEKIHFCPNFLYTSLSLVVPRSIVDARYLVRSDISVVSIE